MRQFVDSLWKGGLALLLLISWGPAAIEANPVPSQGIDAAIRREAVASSSSPLGHPLPLAAHWDPGDHPDGFDPSYQLEQIDSGQYLLPWFRLDPPDSRGDFTYFERTFAKLAARRLPISFLTTEWERAGDLAKRTSAGAIVPLSPFGPVEAWYTSGRRWGEHPVLRKLQELYPDPPLILFVSNNEYPKPFWRELLNTPEVLARTGPHADEAAQRKVISDAWIERYRALVRGFREGLGSETWRQRAKFVGYEAFEGSAVGRWGGWVEYSLQVPGWMSPWPQAWDGASVSLYAHDWEGIADYTVWSPQIEAMNWVPTLRYVLRHKPDFWFEMSTWDGQTPGSSTDKLWFYRFRGQQFTPQRYRGMVQYGMWLLRPRLVREFRGPRQFSLFGRYFDVVMQSVALVHQLPVLSEFWRKGRLVPNTTASHPYQENLPPDFAAADRWFLLDSPANPPRPWKLETPLEVFALALELGREPRRQWLVYAFAPLHERTDVEVRIPHGPAVSVRAGLSGCFTLVSDQDSNTQTLGC